MSRIESLARRHQEISRAHERAVGKYESLSSEYESVISEIERLNEDVQVYDRVTALLSSLGETRQEEAQKVIETFVTRGLQMVFDPTLSFHIIQSVKGKQSVVEFTIRSTFADEVVETPVLESRGGGLAATVGFLLRIVVMLLRKESHILVLDETFAHVSSDRLDNLGEFLRELADKTGVQIIMVTHQDEFLDYADKVYRFSQVNGKTKVTIV